MTAESPERGGNDQGSGPASRQNLPGYEVRYFARKYGLTTAQAIGIMRRVGTDRAKLNEAGARLRRELLDTQRRKTGR